MTVIINDLTPAQRALLHSALLFFKEHADEAFATSVVNDSTPLYKEFYRYTQDELNNLTQQLFADSFIEDLDFVKAFNRQYISRFQSNESNAFSS